MKHDDASQCELVHIPAGLLHRLGASPAADRKTTRRPAPIRAGLRAGFARIEGNNAVFGRTAKPSLPRCCREIALERAKSSAVLGVGDGKG
jgi:hypothetical protein